MIARREPRIAIVSGLPLGQNPRTAREATTLARAGYNVTVLGAELKHASLARDLRTARRSGFEFRCVGSLRHNGDVSRARVLSWHVRHKLGRELFSRFKIENAYQIGYFVPELVREASALEADYYLLHAEQGLWVGAALLRQGRRVGIDMEDWYSEDLSPAARALRPLRRMRRLEAELLRKAVYASCPSQAMSGALAKELGCAPPVVVYNACSWADRASLGTPLRDRKDRRMPSIHWFSQTLGPGRGLDDLMAALPLLTHEAEIHLRGAAVPGFAEWLVSQAPPAWRARIFIHPPVPEDELLARVAEHDIGFAGEQNYCRNKDLTVSNKILCYLTAGLAVLASDTRGQAEVASAADGAVCLYAADDYRSLAQTLDGMLAHPDDLAKMKSAALHAAEQTFSWEKTAPVLLRALEMAIARAGPADLVA